MQKTNPIMQSVRNQPLAWMVQTVGVIFFIGNLYMATQLFPLIRNIDSLVTRVNAIEKRNDTADELIPRFFQLEERDKQLLEDVKEIKKSLKELGRVH